MEDKFMVGKINEALASLYEIWLKKSQQVGFPSLFVAPTRVTRLSSLREVALVFNQVMAPYIAMTDKIPLIVTYLKTKEEITRAIWMSRLGSPMRLEPVNEGCNLVLYLAPNTLYKCLSVSDPVLKNKIDLLLKTESPF